MGPMIPKRGLRFNPNKLLLDPYAKHIDGGNQVERRAVRLPPSRVRAKIF